jgi:hypothetical protein
VLPKKKGGDEEDLSEHVTGALSTIQPVSRSKDSLALRESYILYIKMEKRIYLQFWPKLQEQRNKQTRASSSVLAGRWLESVRLMEVSTGRSTLMKVMPKKVISES